MESLDLFSQIENDVHITVTMFATGKVTNER